MQKLLKTFIDGNDTLVKTTDNGILERMVVDVKLNAGEHWFGVAKIDHETKLEELRLKLTAAAYDKLASIAGISIVTPESIYDDEGRKVRNPHIQRKGGLVDSVSVRLFAIGRGPAGNLRCVDLTFVYALSSYLATDLYQKWLNATHRNNQGDVPDPRPWGRMVGADAPLPVGIEGATKTRIPVGVVGAFLEVDISHPEVLMILRDHQEKQQYAERTAYSMAVRNAVKKLLGVQYANGDGIVQLTVWQDKDRNFQSLATVIDSAQGGNAVCDNEVIEVEREHEVANDEDITAQEEVEQASVKVVKEPEPAPKTTEPTVTESKPEVSEDELRKKVREKMTAISPKMADLMKNSKVMSAMLKAGLTSLQEVKIATIEQLRILNEAL